MSKERYNQIIDELYNDYTQTKIIKNKHLGTETHISPVGHYSKITKEEFINKCKDDTDFSEKWGLKIEERELSTQERNKWFQVHLNGNNPFMKSDWKDFELDQPN